MLHILLCILKIIGWILLAIIGIIVLLISILLFAPVRYKLTAKMYGKPETLFIDLNFNWLFHLMRGHVLYDKEKLDWCMKAAWKNFSNEDEEKEESVLEEDFMDKGQITESLSKPQKDNSITPVIEEEKVFYKEEKKETENPSKKKKYNFSEKIRGVLEKIKYTFQKMCATIKSVQKKKDYVERFLKNKTHRRAWDLLFRQIKKLVRRIKPKKISGDIEFGTEDPALTGKILALVSMIYPFTGEHIEIKPDFDEKKLNVDVFVSGRVYSVSFIYLALRLIISKDVRLTYKHIRKLINKM